MPIEFNCESCSKLLRVPDGSGGKQCLCPGCSKVLNIPTPQAAATPIATSPNDGADIALCIPCPKCKHELICDPSLVGTKGQCRSCKHIFVISDLPTNEVAVSKPAIVWVFSCPRCNQLFEGNEPMQGKRGKCHACGNVFAIELRIAEQASDNSVAEAHQKPEPPPNSRDNNRDELTLEEPPKPSKLTSESAPKPVRSATSSGTVVSKASRSDLPPIQFNCTSCRGRMEVPGEAAQQLTHCPHCKRQLSIPTESDPTPEDLAANDPWADLSPLGSAPTPMQQSSPFGDTLYPPTPMSSMSPLPPSGRRRSNDPTQHIVCGIFISLFAMIAVAIEIYEIVIYTIVFVAAGSSNPVAATVAGWIIAVSVFLLILSILQLIGGISLARRTGINLARTGVVICCLPCFCLVNIAFGIWGCLLVFGNNAERDFR
jgi:hypothetical protein